MASASPLKDIDEQYLQCCICMEQLKEPKILPCLHRYCRECLERIVKKGAKKIECVTCREVHTLPKGGIDSLKTDFNTKNIIEFIQLQDSVKVDPLRTCIHCRKKQKASAFCFRCNDFLCETCHEFHASSTMFEDHHPHIFSLSEAEAANLTIQKLSSLKVAPRCQTHPEKLSELCCTTCGNLPICVPCTFGEHRGHNLEEVKSLAKIQREMLRGKIADLLQYKEKAYSMREEIKKTKDKLELNVDQESRKLREQLDREGERIKKEIHDAEKELNTKRADLEKRMKEETSARKKQLEKEMRESRERYEQACREEQQEADLNFRRLKEENTKVRGKLEGGLRVMNNEIQELLASIRTQKDENVKKIKELSDHFDDIVKKFENVTATADYIFAAQNDWTDVQCIPDVCRAVDLLREEAKRDSPGMGDLSGVKIRGLSAGVTVRGKVGISEDVESVIDLHIKESRYITDITGNEVGTIVITGWTSDYQTYIAVITKAEVLQQQHIFPEKKYHIAKCSFLSRYLIAVICGGNQVGIYDIRDQSRRFIRLSDVIMNCPTYQQVSSVTTDPVNDHIIVGCDSRDVYVFNSELEHVKTTKLPDVIKFAGDIAMYKGNLFVCDSSETRRAFAVALKQTASEVKYEFTKPMAGGSNRYPCRLCIDQNGYIYMLWMRSGGRSLIVQYTKDGGQIELEREVDGTHDAIAIIAVQTKQGEKLLLPTDRTNKLLTYGLT